MMGNNVIRDLEIVVKEKAKEGSHDYNHINRVRKMALNIAENYDCRKDYVEILSLIHDLCDHKYFNGDVNNYLSELLQDLNISNYSEYISDILNFGFSTNSSNLSLEAKIVSDADRLDAIGAIGIARCFSFSGETHRELYNPDIPLIGLSREDYKKYGSATALNHFYDKLFKIKETLYTDYAKKLAEEREKYMREFVSEFLLEWEGTK